MHHYDISKRELATPNLTIGKLLKIAAESKDIISLGPGEPDFNAPKKVISFTKKALDKGLTHYSPLSGTKNAKNAIAGKLKRFNKIRVKNPDEEVIVTNGSTEALFLSMMVMLDPGEEILLPNPGFMAYTPMAELLNAKPVYYGFDHGDAFKLHVDELERKVTANTRMLLLNTPSNPLGTVLTKKELEGVLEVAVEHDLVIVSDEAYEELVYDDAKHVSIGSLNGAEDYVLTLGTVSKTYAMPAYRIGYAAGPAEVIREMGKAHLSTSLCASSFSQEAAAFALSGNVEKDVERMRKEYNRRRKLIVSRLNEIEGFDCVEPKGAFYAFPRFDFNMSSLEFAEWLLKNAKVAVVPGTEFGSKGEGFVRMSYATAYDKIGKAMDLIEKAVKRL